MGKKYRWTIPYRWRPSTLWYEVTGGVRNLVRWAPVIWRDRDYDWEYLAQVMEWKLRRMAEAEIDSYHLNAERDRKQILICAELLKRLQADDYFQNAGYDSDGWKYVPDDRKSRIIKHSLYMAKQDQRYLGLMLGKYLQNWWS